MADPRSSEQALSDLLDSALEDFGKLEANSSEREVLINTVQGLGTGLPSLPDKKKGKQKVGSSEKLPQETSPSSSVDSHVADTLQKLAEQTRQTLQGLDSASSHEEEEDDVSEKMVESLLKKFEDLGSKQDMQTVVDLMMHQLLSKEVLYEPMKEISEKYPEWLERKKDSLSKEDYFRYSNQYELTKQLCHIYETEPENFEKIVELMQKMQECGQPPSDIVQELAPGFDMTNQGMPAISELLNDNATSKCSIM